MNILQAIEQQTKSKLFVSLAAKPGSTGSRFYTALFKHHNIDAEYVACQCDDISIDMEIVREHCDGASITMPYKQTVINYIDHVAHSATAINTVVNDSGVLTGYNCDLMGLNRLLPPLLSNATVVILGDGAMADNVKLLALANNAQIIQCSRTKDWDLRHTPADVLINTTPIGMGTNDSPVDRVFQVGTVVDCVIGPTRLIEMASTLGKDYVTGSQIYVEQFVHQFKLYTGQTPDETVVAQVAKEIFNV